EHGPGVRGGHPPRPPQVGHERGRHHLPRMPRGRRTSRRHPRLVRSHARPLAPHTTRPRHRAGPFSCPGDTLDPFDQFAPAPLLPGALCAQTGYGDLWFPERGVNPHAAKETCARCPLLTSCLTYALTHPEHGVWGATTEAERDVLTGRR